MKTIYKYTLELTSDTQEIEMPENSRILNVQLQRDIICMWVLCYIDNPTEKRYFFIAGTGHPIASIDPIYLGTVQEGNFVWHIFEVKP